MNTGNIRIAIYAILGLLLLAIVGAVIFRKHKTTPPAFSYFDMEKIKSIKELHLINCSFEQRIDIHKKDDPAKDIEAVLIVPVQVDACINLGAVSFKRTNDSVLQQIILPHSYYSPINIMMDKGNLTRYKKRFVIFGTVDDSKLWQTIQAQTKNTDKAITDKADSMHILQRADSEAQVYIRSMLDSINYKRSDFKIVFADTSKHAISVK